MHLINDVDMIEDVLWAIAPVIHSILCSYHVVLLFWFQVDSSTNINSCISYHKDLNIFVHSCFKTSGDTFGSSSLYNTFKEDGSLSCSFKGWLIRNGVWNFSNNDRATTFQSCQIRLVKTFIFVQKLDLLF